MVPKFGLESVIYLDGGNAKNEVGRKRKRDEQSAEQMAEFCAANGIRLFQEVKVSLEVAERKDQRKRIEVRLVQPKIDGFSIVTDCETDLPA